MTLNGPAFTVEGNSIVNERDAVFALKCSQWPKGARVPADEQNPQKWPTMDMKKEAESTGCLVVAVAGKDSQYEDFEWRISTSKAERILMFSLNETQINCLILLKIVLKSFIHPKCGKVISSYMCKNILFHQIKKGHPELWQAHTLFECFKTCILELHECVRQKCLPHFIMPENNLLRGKLTDEVQTQVVHELDYIIEMDTDILRNIEIGDIGQRIGVKVNQNSTSLTLPTSGDVSNQDKQLTQRLTYTKTNELTKFLDSYVHVIIFLASYLVLHISCLGLQLAKITPRQILAKLEEQRKPRDLNEFVIPILKSFIGCNEASTEMANKSIVSDDILNKWFPECIKEDNIWPCLKKALIHYCNGDVLKAEYILEEINRHVDANKGLKVCFHQFILFMNYINLDDKRSFYLWNTVFSKYISTVRQKTLQTCMFFMWKEIHIVPKEIQYEMLRSSIKYKANEDMCKGTFFDVIYSFLNLPTYVDVSHFLYFLQFKVYQQLDKQNEKNKALKNLQDAISSDVLSCHRDIAYNLLGQCLEQENRPDEAIVCYGKSLKIQPENNMAIIHVCILLCKIIEDKKLLCVQ